MKKTILFLCLIAVSFGFSQSLPINFEDDITTEDFVNFEGGIATVVDNPSATGSNTSTTVARIIRDGGVAFAGAKILLTDNLDFSELTKISMKVYTTAPVGTLVKFKLEGEGAADVNTTTTVSSEWETLEWIFAGTPNTLNEIVFMFDFGNIGDGSANSTFYFDDIKQIEGPLAPIPMSLPIDFETGIVDTDFLNFNGSIASVIANPQIEGINTSATVGQIVRDGGDFFASSRLFFESTIDLSTQSQISMKVYTTAPVGTRIKLELEGSSAPSTNLDYLTTVSGEWEIATFNFSGHDNVYDKMQFLFDFGNVGDGTANSTFLFDDVQLEEGLQPEPASLPIDFENSVVTSDFTNFFGSMAFVIPNPQIDENNPSATVGQFVRNGGAGFMRSKLALTDFIENMSTLGTISMKIYTDAPVGSLLKFKLESNETPVGKEQDVLTTVSGGWATYTWDLSNGDVPIYNVLTLMLGYNGASDSSANATFLFDDIQQVATLSDGIDQTLNLDDISIYPNPAKDILTISSKNKSIKTIALFDILGNQVTVLNPNSLSATIDVSDFASGIYIARISTPTATGSLKVVIE
jgi:hypothetical protein